MLFTPRDTETKHRSKNDNDPFFKSAVNMKLAVGSVDDPLEREADRTADSVVDNVKNPQPNSFFTGKPVIQQKTKENTNADEKEQETEVLSPLQKKEDQEETLQAKCAECEEQQPVQKKAQSDNPTTATAISGQLKASKGGGEKLPDQAQQEMNSGFGHDFSNVRIHTDSNAVQMSRQLGAQAFTNGNDIYFNQGKFDPQGTEGRHLLAHELTHTVQQGASAPMIQKQDAPDNLGQLNEMLDRFNVPEEDVISLLSNLTLGEKQTVLTDSSYKRRMASAFDVSEMVRAIRILDPTLEEQLTWINEAALFTRAIDYSEISEFVIAAPQTERDALKTATWRSFFVSVCTNATMVTALNDLHFDLETKLTWLNAEVTITSWELTYSDIKAWITAAPQTERDVLKTSTWRSFFVSVCDNTTMVEALNDLNYDLETKLTWLEAEMTITSWELDYITIQPWITAASQAERDALKTAAWRSFFVAVCTNATMVTALNDLNYDLETKLTWLNDEMTITRWELDYGTIQPWITAAPQATRDVLKTNTWRDFFTAVCDNTTIKTALDDLNFDFATAITWYIDEVALSSIDDTWLCAYYTRTTTFPAGEDTIACAIMTRDIRDGNFNSTPEHTPAGWALTAHNQLLVANEMNGMVGGQSTWNPSWQNSTNTFATWAKAASETAAPPLTAATEINCWEMVMLAAYRAGILSWTRIHTIYTTTTEPDWGAFMVNQLSYSSRRPYSTSSRPVAGDIIFFDGPAHISLATGTVDGLGRTQIYSFWPPPNTAFVSGGTLDTVKITTIEELNDYWVARGNAPFTVEYATPRW